jgi:hypothetical protein
MARSDLSRRDWLRVAGLASVVSFTGPGWLRSLAADAATHPQRKRSCILLWMSGGPATIDLFDLKPGHPNGGPYKERETSVPGIKIGEHLPKLAEQMQHLAILRGMQTKEGDHGRATYHLRTGNLPQGAIEFPTLGSLVAKELTPEKPDLPGFIAIGAQRGVSLGAYSAGFLGPKYAPMFVADGQGVGNDPNFERSLRVPDLDLPSGVSREQSNSRIDLLREAEETFLSGRPGVATDSHKEAYDQAVRLMKAEATKAFDLKEEPAKLRDAYGRNLFGQGCLLARRLVERGVPFVEVGLGGVQGGNWDSHANNFDQVKAMCGVLDPAWATLIADLKDHGLLETTTVVWMGEFGRTPKINPQRGRDHFPTAWATVVGGGGIKGGQVIGKTSKDGMTVEERPISVPDLLSTVVRALGIDPDKQNTSNVDRPIRIVDRSANPIKEILG